MYCSECGKLNQQNHKYCAGCGNKLTGTNNINKTKDLDISLVLGITCIVSSIFFNIICFIPGIISIVYSVKRKRETGKLGVGFGLSLGGMIFSFIVFILGVLVFVAIFNYVDEGYYGNYYDNDVEYTYNLSDI